MKAINARSRGWAGADFTSRKAMIAEETADILAGARRLWPDLRIDRLAMYPTRRSGNVRWYRVVLSDGNAIAAAWIDSETQLPVYMPTWSTPWE